jgi:hypothetical protein
MRTRIDAPFATPKQTAAVLGVSSSRMKKLVGLTRDDPDNHSAAFSTPERSIPKRNGRIASRRRHARGKASKAAR